MSGPRRDPLRPPAPALVPPGARSRQALEITAAAAEGRFALHACAACGAFAWPPREICPRCLGPAMRLTGAPDGGRLLSETRAMAPTDPYFRARAPWRVGLVALDCGPVALVHLHPRPVAGDRVRLRLLLDRAGQGVLHAGPEGETEVQDDPQWQEMTADPRGRRVLLTDARHWAAPALVQALLRDGAAGVLAGLPEAWKPCAAAAELAAMPGVRVLPLDVGDARSVADLARDHAAQVEILIDTTDHPRPGGLGDATAILTAQAAWETMALGTIRLATGFGPAMRARAAEGAVAWVRVLPADALAAPPGRALHGAAAAAALALVRALRAEMLPAGIRVMTALHGPGEGPWDDGLAPPRVAARALAEAVVAGLRRGLEEVVVGEVARDLAARLADNPKAVERELARDGG